MCVCVYVCAYIQLCACTHVYVYVYTCMYMCLFVCVHVCLYMFVCLCVCVLGNIVVVIGITIGSGFRPHFIKKNCLVYFSCFVLFFVCSSN